MTDKQTKGFYQDIDEHDTFQVSGKEDALKKEAQDKMVGRGDGFVMDISADKKKIDKIFLKKTADSSNLTGNPFSDAFIQLNNYLIEHSKVKSKDISVTFRLLATMINAGIPLIKSLNTLGVQAEKSPRLQKILFDLAQMLEGGSNLSKAMGKYPDVFTEAQLGAIQAGEISGQLNATFKNMATESEKAASIAGKVKGAMIYPIVILVILFAVIFVMMLLVIPQISGLYTQAGKDLPLVTQILIISSDFTVAYWWLIILIIFGSIFGLLTWKKSKSGKYYWDYLMLKIPVFGNLVQKSTLAKFSYSFGNLLSSGVPIIKAIEIVSLSVGNEVYRKRFLLTAEDMRSGIPLAENMSNSKLFPTMLVNMIEVGEQTAQLDDVTKKVAKFYNEEVNTAVTSLTKIMEPLIIVFVGLTVGGLVAAIMLPIMQLTTLVG